MEVFGWIAVIFLIAFVACLGWIQHHSTITTKTLLRQCTCIHRTKIGGDSKEIERVVIDPMCPKFEHRYPRTEEER